MADAVPQGQRSPGQPAEDGLLSCPSCHVRLALPSARQDEVVTGPCPACGWMLTLSHGRIEGAPLSAAGSGPEIDMPWTPKPGAGSRSKLPRTGTLDMARFHSQHGAGHDHEEGWGAAPALPEAGEEDMEPAVWRKPWGHRAWLWAALGAVVLGVGALAWRWSRPPPPLLAPRPASPGTGGNGPRSMTPDWGDAALAAWQAFATAGSIDEKLAHVIDAGRVEPALRAFYTANPDSDAEWAAREFRPLAGTPDDQRRGLVALGYSPASAGERPIILFFRLAPAVAADARGPSEAAPRFLLDWETYIQESQRIAETFVLDPAAPRRTLRLAVERIHVFGESDGPHPDDRQPRSEPLGLKLRTPSGLFLPVTAEVRHGTPLHDRFHSQLRWGMTAYATLRLAWDSSLGPPPRLLVTDIVCWHFPGPGNPPEVETDLSPVPPPQ